MTWLLDTNIVAYVLNDAGSVRARLNEYSRVGRVVTSIIVVAELMYGVERSARREANRGRVERELASIEVAPLTLGAVTHFGRLKAELRTRGIAKSDLDLLIAASALDLGATLVTHDQALLDGAIQGLAVEDWYG
ncbi:MAG TPA: PIN domain-containing protein [Polyangia bacterium]|nr:PIN domain-containing protein [Polyangia bacterium]